MLSKRIRIVVGFLGTALMLIFVLGLAHSISTGFAGFWGGLPVWIIALAVLSMAVYDFWDECVRKEE